MRKFYLIILTFIPSSLLFSQADSAGVKELSEVIVTGQMRPQSAKNSVYQVRVIDNDRIRLSGSINVQQVLTNQLGFRFSNDNTLGTTDVQLLGMSGRNVKILLDGVPLLDRGDTRESLLQVDINSIDRIEIVEGPMSVSYGSDALAGVINIITKRPTQGSLSVRAKLQEETAGAEYYPFSYKGVHMQSVGVDWQKENWSLSAGGNHTAFEGFGGDDFGRAKSWRPKEQWMGNARIGYHKGALDIYYRLDGLHEEISSRGPINTNAYTALDQYYITHRYLHQVQSQWRIHPSVELVTLAALTDYSRRTKTIYKDFLAGTSEPGTAAGQQDVSGFNSFVFRNTLNYHVSDHISLQPGLDINYEKASGARIKGDPAIADYAFFISSEWQPDRGVNIRPGLRFIRNSVYEAPPVVPSINTKFRLGKEADIRLAYAAGFRSPALRELYFNFIDASHTIIGNPDLKAERSNSFNGSFTWSPVKLEKWQFKSVLGSFYNVFDNLISYASSPTSTDTTTTVNIEHFKTTGFTWESSVKRKNLSATLGFSYIGRFNRLSEDKTYEADNLPEFVWSPEVNSNLLYTISRIDLTVGVFYKYTGRRPGYQVVFNDATSQDEVQLTKVDAFHWADLTVTRPFFSYLTLSAGVRNLFDVTNLNNTAGAGGGAHSSGASVPVSYGRSYFIGVGFQWNKKQDTKK